MSGRYEQWATQLPEGELIDLDDIQRAFPDKTRAALKMALKRLCETDDPLLARMTRGIYCRRILGERSRLILPPSARRRLAWRVAGTGAGLTGPNIINKLSWSTQVSPRIWLAVVGRPPRCPASGAVFVGRSNSKRLGLGAWEVSLLEAVRCFDEWSELSWDQAVRDFKYNISHGYYGRVKFRADTVMEAVAVERGLGKSFLPRCEELATASMVTSQ